MSQPLFSIIVPVYKVEQYLERCIKSLVNQTVECIEIVLVDDGSPDTCPDICDAWAKKDERIVVVHKKNGGLSDARNTGIEKATGKYIMFVDSDDYIDLDSCERLLQFTKDNTDVIVSDGIAEGGNMRLTHLGIVNQVAYKGTEFLRNSIISGKIPMVAWLYVYRRKFLLDSQLRFKTGIYHEDEEFTPRALLQAQSVVNTGERYYHYVIRENSIMTKKDKRKNAVDLFAICQSLSLIYDKLDDSEFKLYLKDSLVNKYLSLFQEGRLYQYGSEYLHKDFVVKNAYKKRTKKKAFLYNLSPRLYWYINTVL